MKMFCSEGGDGNSNQLRRKVETSQVAELITKLNNILSVCSVYPKKCHGNFRKHLMDEHRDRVIEIFRCD